MQYLLDVAPFEAKDDDGNPIALSEFDVKAAARMFDRYVRPSENLLTAKLVLIPRFHRNHYTLYVMNRYTSTLDIFDTIKYSKLKGSTRTAHHKDRVEIMSKMVSLMKEVYGIDEYNKKNIFPWEVLTEKCNYFNTPEQEANECGFYVLKFARTFDDVELVEKIKPKDRHVEDWKAEHMYQLMFHPKNEIPRAEWPAEVTDLLLLLGLASQSFQE